MSNWCMAMKAHPDRPNDQNIAYVCHRPKGHKGRHRCECCGVAWDNQPRQQPTAARAVALILAWVRRERTMLLTLSPHGAEEYGRIATLDALEKYILTLLPGKGKGGKK